jgi:D-alanine-D-alanine ligase
MNNSVRIQNWVSKVRWVVENIDRKDFGKVGVLLGGRSAEREISLQSGSGVLAALQSIGIDAHPFDPGIDPIETLYQRGFNRVFISLHGRWGEDGTIQGMLDQLGIPYTGSGVLASAMAIDKEVTKNIWRSKGLSTPNFAMLNKNTDWSKLETDLGLPIIVKPAREGSSLGLTKVKDVSELPHAYELAAKLDRDVMGEECILGDELTCPIICDGEEVIALPMILIKAPQANFDYHNKYFSNDTQYICPPEIDPAIAEEVEQLAIESFKALGCSGWGRADVMIKQSSGKPYLLEMNTSPGMTSHSLVPMAAAKAGISYEHLVLWILYQTIREAK